MAIETFETAAVSELRKAVRVMFPETRKTGSIAHVGTKEDLIAFLRGRAVIPDEANEAILRDQEQKGEKNSSGDLDFDDVPAPATTVPAAPSLPEKTVSNDDDVTALEMLRKVILKDAKPEIDMAKIEEFVNGKFENHIEFVKEAIDAAAEAAKKASIKRLVIITPDEKSNDVGICHKKTADIIAVANLGIHQMLVGPAGGGKTTACEKVAEALGLEFFPMSVGPQTTKSDLLGFIDATGNYHSTPLRKAFEKGGLLLLDEVDAANAGVLTIINAMLTNGYCSFPDGVIKRHEKFCCICACNTYGRGADREYVGRNQLDAATLDRFAVVDFEYDEELEKALAGNTEWVEIVQGYRHKAQEIKARVVISPRASINGAKMLAAGFSLESVKEMVVWKGIPADIRTKIEGGRA